MRKLSYNTTFMVAILAISLFSATPLLSLQSANAQGQKANQQIQQLQQHIKQLQQQIQQVKKTKTTNAPAAPIGNVQQLSKALGNNTKILASNIHISAAPQFY